MIFRKVMKILICVFFLVLVIGTIVANGIYLSTQYNEMIENDLHGFGLHFLVFSVIMAVISAVVIEIDTWYVAWYMLSDKSKKSTLKTVGNILCACLCLGIGMLQIFTRITHDATNGVDTAMISMHIIHFLIRAIYIGICAWRGTQTTCI